MSDKPILFSAPMVRALLDGRKTQTRRAVSRIRTCAMPENSPCTMAGDDMAAAFAEARDFRRMDGNIWSWKSAPLDHQAPAAFTSWLAHIGHAVGDRLWVRESGFQISHADHHNPTTGRDIWAVHGWKHTADGTIVGFSGHYPVEYIDDCSLTRRPSIHMPRWTSRITLVVTDVRVQRLQDISEDDAIAEGVYPAAVYGGKVESWLPAENMRDRFYPTARDAYAALWDSINGAGSWGANPWVVAYTFTTHKMNIDDMRKDEANG